jgi:purine-binding chemotaxis protein CheW
MSTLTLVSSEPRPLPAAQPEELVTFTVGRQMFGIAARQVQDVLRAQPLTRIPLARPEVAGALNLRGHIVTAIDMRRRLGLSCAGEGKGLCVVIAAGDELFSLLVDGVGEVLTPLAAEYEENPPSLDPLWCGMSRGILRTETGLLVVLDVDRIVDLARGN